MSDREKAEKRIEELKLALELARENEEFYLELLGGRKQFEKWIDYRLDEYKQYMNILEEE